jgi:Terminase-like family.
MSTLIQTIKTIGRTFDNFTKRGGAIQMRPYQLEPAEAIIDSVMNKRGLTFVIIISRQAGKDELLANLICYLMNLYAHREVGIVVANPTYKPQTLNFLMRLENRLKANLLTQAFWKKRADYMRMIGNAVTSLLSGDKESNVVGATASLLLVINEAQDITPAKYDKDFAPMVASTNATRIIVGTQWTSNTLLAREQDAALAAEKADGIKRVFVYTAEDVRKVNKPYGQFVDSELRKLGREHPLVKTQYFCERIDAQTGMFNARRLALMQGDQDPQDAPVPGHAYAFLIDVAGQDEGILELEGMRNPGRDKTTLDVIDIDLTELDLLQAPIYRAVKRLEWQGNNHVDIFGAISALASVWHPLYIVEDATGAGEGLWGMLYRKFTERVIGFKYTAQSKSELGYGFIAIIESGRFRDCVQDEASREQYANCQSEILIGPSKTMRWSVPDGTRNQMGLLIHDDIITTDALTAQLDLLEWYISAPTVIIEQADVLETADKNF